MVLVHSMRGNFVCEPSVEAMIGGRGGVLVWAELAILAEITILVLLLAYSIGCL